MDNNILILALLLVTFFGLYQALRPYYAQEKFEFNLPIERIETVQKDGYNALKIVRGKEHHTPAFIFEHGTLESEIFVRCTSPTSGYVDYKKDGETKRQHFIIAGNTIVFVEKPREEKE